MRGALVSVVMPVYNAEAFLEVAVKSVLDQTVQEVEVFAVNDGSTDGSGEILDALARADCRLKVIHQENGGMVSALNAALDRATAPFVARMDADDISLPTRFEVQTRYLAEHPEIDACGSWMETFSPTRTRTRRLDTDDSLIRGMLPFNCNFPHPAGMFRSSFFEGGLRYRAEYRHGEDYDLWTRACATKRFHTLPTVLYRYRQHEGQGTRLAAHHTYTSRIRREFLERFRLGTIDEDHYELHEIISRGEGVATLEELRQCAEWIERLRQANVAERVVPLAGFDQAAAAQWYEVCRASSGLGIAAWKCYRQGLPYRTPKIGAKEQVTLAVRCIGKRHSKVGYRASRSQA